ncbi:MAG: ABC-F family ATP-binding cassette domain-containing protein [Clostridiales bacterium]|jgi:ATP-binding cassette subfamily F protein 3|nr:ABC-F family ATP-binding cassette domain-containing protein [Clostridiales bacterium]
MILSCKDIEKAYGAETVLSSVSFLIEEGEKAAVVGVNGAGKTTLFRVILGETPHDGGEVILKKGADMGYLSQSPEFLDNSGTAQDELMTVFAETIELEAELRRLETAMSGLSGAALKSLMEKYDRTTREFEEGKGYSYKSLVKGVIKGLGFTGEELKLPLSALSGGQRARVALGKLLLREPDILLLDEPTNHLDMDAVAWLEDYLSKSFSGSLLMISHDRYFINSLASKIIEIENGVSKVYNGNYSAYAFQKEADRDSQIRRYVNQQREIKRQEAIIRRFRSYAQEWSIKRAKTREKMLAKVKRLELPKNTQKMRIILEPQTFSGNDVLHAEGVKKAFNEPLFENVGFDIYRGEVVALIGLNGVGKTTLLNCLLGRISYGGLIRLGAGVRIGYYDQEQSGLHPGKTVFNEIYDAYPHMKEQEIRTNLAAFMFCGDDVFKAVESLSGGEKGRLSLCKLMLGKANFLLMDEPTNHLDIFSREILEEAVRSYTGTVLYVSHDRYFISSTADKVIELTPTGAVTYNGGYDYYLEKRAERAETPEEREETATESKSDWLRRKDEESRERKRQTRSKRLESDIAAAEERIKMLDARLALPEVATDAQAAQACYEERAGLEERLHKMYEEWMAYSE